MILEEAEEMARKGTKMTRPAWNGDFFLYTDGKLLRGRFIGETCFTDMRAYAFSDEDRKAGDWAVAYAARRLGRMRDTRPPGRTAAPREKGLVSVFQDDGPAFVFPVAGKQVVFLQVSLSLAGKGRVIAVPAYARAEILGHGQALGVNNIAAEERPRPADIRLACMDSAAFSFPEEDAGAVAACADLQLAAPFLAVFPPERFSVYPKNPGNAAQILGAHHDTPLPVAALTAHAAGKHGAVINGGGYFPFFKRPILFVVSFCHSLSVRF